MTLRGQLNLGALLLSVLLVGMLLVVEGYFIRAVAYSYVETRLQHDGDAVAGAVSFAGQTLSLDEQRIPGIYQQPLSGHYFFVDAGREQIRSRSLWDQTLSLDRIRQGGGLQQLPGPQGEPLLVVTAGYAIDDRTVKVVVAESILDIDRQVLRAQLMSAGILLLLLFFFGYLQHRWIARSLQPVDRLQQQLVELRDGRRQALTVQLPAELRPLAEEINLALEMLAQRLQRSRHALGNLAHALQGPVAVISQRLQSPALDAAALNEMRTQIEAIQQRVKSELGRARIAGQGGGSRQRLNLHQELSDLVQTLHLIHADKDLAIRLDVDPGIGLIADRQDLLELLGNLLDNACKWARHEILIRAELTDRLCLSITDDGPGAAPELMQSLVRRGQRLDESAPGHGLGLSIVAEILAGYGGDIQFQPAEGGGLTVTLCLPLSASFRAV